jgi:curved DNA-binding protein CbpA
MISHRSHSIFTILLLLLTLLHTNANEATPESSSTTSSTADEPTQKPIDPEKDWGSFYDPKNVFCGKYDCYKILGFDYFAWGGDPPSIKEITKSYRSLSRQWHPDKNKSRGAREKFVAIAKAYEVLTDTTKRTEYDHFRDRPDEYFRKYGSGVLWEYAPKSDATFVILLFLVVGSAFTYYAQKNRWETIAKHLIRAACEDWSAVEGGSAESAEIREKALGILAERKGSGVDGSVDEKEDGGGNKKSKAGDKKKKGPKMSSKEKKEKEIEELRPIIVELVNEIDDFGAGFRKPTMHDLLVVRMVKWPYRLTKWLLWWGKYGIRRLKKLEYNEEEREALTISAVGEVAWVAASDEDREKMLTMDLWVMDNLVAWKEEQEMNQLGLSATKKKQIKKLKKRGVLPDDDYYDKMD